MISDLTLECAKVIDIDDKDQQGKIQINIESRFKNFKKDLLPWAIPLISDTSNSTMSFNPPSVGSQVWVLTDKFYKRFYYISNRYFYNLFDFSKISGLLNKCNKINKDYKNIRFTYFADGSLIFHNNNDGSSGIINSQGTYIYIDSEGSLIKTINKDEIIDMNGNRTENIKGKVNGTIQGNSEYTINGKEVRTSMLSSEYSSNGSISLKSKTIGQVEIGNTISTLGNLLTELCADLSSIMIVSPIGSPQPATPDFIARISSLMAKIKLVLL